LFDGHFVASLYVQFARWTPGQRSIFGRERPSHIDPNQLCPIPDIDFAAARIVRYAERSLFAMPKGLYCRTQADTRQTAKQPSGGEFRPCAQLFVFILFVFFSPERLVPTYVEDGGRRLPGAVSK
jgi:hypothetical protein